MVNITLPIAAKKQQTIGDIKVNEAFMLEGKYCIYLGYLNSTPTAVVFTDIGVKLLYLYRETIVEPVSNLNITLSVG